MKKIIILLIVMTISYIFIGNVFAKSSIIPEDAIRIRIIANSNSEYDQNVKLKVKDKVQLDMYNILKNTRSTIEAKQLIQDNLPLLQKDIKNTLEKENYNLPFTINYGLNYFPKKEFKGITYDAGYYESVVVTLGEGLGDNWWCVLFPPLCSLEAEEASDVEYTTMTQELLKKYF